MVSYLSYLWEGESSRIDKVRLVLWHNVIVTLTVLMILGVKIINFKIKIN